MEKRLRKKEIRDRARTMASLYSLKKLKRLQEETARIYKQAVKEARYRHDEC